MKKYKSNVAPSGRINEMASPPLGLPNSPGIYKMLDKEGRIIYVGKALNLRKRVTSYFRKDYQHSSRTRKLMAMVQDIQFIETDTELESLILESNLIKEIRPKYNILMKDDKSYVYIKVALDEDFPRITIERERTIEKTENPRNRKARYFGPKLASGRVFDTLKIIKKLFPHRSCGLKIKWNAETDDVTVTNKVIDYPCLDYSIKLCPGPCISAITPEVYKKVIHQIVDFLDGKNDELENSIKAQMSEAASQKQFEKAANLRDKLFALQSVVERQKITDIERRDTDVINFVLDMGRLYFNIMQIRNGKLISQENFMFDAHEMKEDGGPIEITESLQAFIVQYYERAADIPKEILIPENIEDKAMIEKWLEMKRSCFAEAKGSPGGDRVYILTPQKGEKNKLLELSLKNAVSYSKQYKIKWMAEEAKGKASERLAEALGLKNLKRIEGFDISHLGGQNTVGSMVVFENGVSKSSDYRHFKLRTVQNKPDDFRCMEEVLTRRLKYLSKKTNVRIKKASKKDISLIEKWGKELKWKELYDSPDITNFFMIKVGKETIGMVRFFELQKGIFTIEALYILKEHRGKKLSYTVYDKLFKQIKDKKARIYVSVEPMLVNHYLEYGFTELKQAPEFFAKRNTEWEKFDGVKYEILAYYLGNKKALDKSFSAKPDLFVIDGGKGQLKSAVNALKSLNLEIPVISLAKRLEEIFVPDATMPIVLEKNDEALKLLQRIRDESHRFAITFQRDLRGKMMFE